MQKITPFLWFNDQAEEAIHFYLSIFNDAKIIDTHYLPESQPDLGQKLLTSTFQLEGQQFMALNGGPCFQFSPAISLFVSCTDQAEVDRLWQQLSAEGSKERCGWLKDKFGVSWQIIPKKLGELLGSSNPQKVHAVMGAMMKMQKIDIANLEQAYQGS
jgi:predicted 3-demethylubiquinone-9 3-methyltransferase (glyoxalase superfamily)